MLTKKYGIESANTCTGAVVVIDVLRAFTTAAYCFHGGVTEIFLVSKPEEAFTLLRKNPDFILIGENHGRKISGFHHGNSPEEISRADLQNRSVVLRSSSGTQGVVQATQATQIYLGSLVVAKSSIEYIKKNTSEPISLLAMGSVLGPDKDEDLICADYMESIYFNKPLDLQHVCNVVRNSPSGQQALDPSIDFKTPGDLECATQIDKFNFVMPVFREGNYLISRKKISQ